MEQVNEPATFNTLRREIRTRFTIFVAGHNNTVPAMVSSLSGDTYPTIPESEYDNLYVVTIYRFGKAKVLKIKYGKTSTQGVSTGTMVPMNK